MYVCVCVRVRVRVGSTTSASVAMIIIFILYVNRTVANMPKSNLKWTGTVLRACQTEHTKPKRHTESKILDIAAHKMDKILNRCVGSMSSLCSFYLFHFAAGPQLTDILHLFLPLVAGWCYFHALLLLVYASIRLNMRLDCVHCLLHSYENNLKFLS